MDTAADWPVPPGMGKSREQLERELQEMHNAGIRGSLVAGAPRHGPPRPDEHWVKNRRQAAMEFNARFVLEANRTRKLCGLRGLSSEQEKKLRDFGFRIFGLKAE